jgi:hypothetical protein
MHTPALCPDNRSNSRASQRTIKVGTICYMVRARIHPRVIGDLVTVLSTLRWSDIWQQSYYEISKPAHAPKYRKFFARRVCLRPINDPDQTLRTVDHDQVPRKKILETI